MRQYFWDLVRRSNVILSAAQHWCRSYPREACVIACCFAVLGLYFMGWLLPLIRGLLWLTLGGSILVLAVTFCAYRWPDQVGTFPGWRTGIKRSSGALSLAILGLLWVPQAATPPQARQLVVDQDMAVIADQQEAERAQAELWSLDRRQADTDKTKQALAAMDMATAKRLRQEAAAKPAVKVPAVSDPVVEKPVKDLLPRGKLVKPAAQVRVDEIPKPIVAEKRVEGSLPLALAIAERRVRMLDRFALPVTWKYSLKETFDRWPRSKQSKLETVDQDRITILSWMDWRDEHWMLSFVDCGGAGGEIRCVAKTTLNNYLEQSVTNHFDRLILSHGPPQQQPADALPLGSKRGPLLREASWTLGDYRLHVIAHRVPGPRGDCLLQETAWDAQWINFNGPQLQPTLAPPASPPSQFLQNPSLKPPPEFSPNPPRKLPQASRGISSAMFDETNLGTTLISAVSGGWSRATVESKLLSSSRDQGWHLVDDLETTWWFSGRGIYAATFYHDRCAYGAVIEVVGSREAGLLRLAVEEAKHDRSHSIPLDGLVRPIFGNGIALREMVFGNHLISVRYTALKVPMSNGPEYLFVKDSWDATHPGFADGKR